MPVHASQVVVILCMLFTFAEATAHAGKGKAAKKYVLVWSDEFNGENDSQPDLKKWTYDIGGTGWGNHELEYYTNRRENVHIEDGKLVITARREDFTSPEGAAFLYTSARLKTEGLFAQTYGRFEACIKIPSGQGIWPAFWLLGENVTGGGWPARGEIDIMENIGREPVTAHSSLHGPSSTRRTSDLTRSISISKGKLADKFHLYAVEWEPCIVRFYLDDRKFATIHKSDLPTGGIWVFDHPFFIVLNVAVGGDLPGEPDETTRFPQKMLVDYVRVYQRRP